MRKSSLPKELRRKKCRTAELQKLRHLPRLGSCGGRGSAGLQDCRTCTIWRALGAQNFENGSAGMLSCVFIDAKGGAGNCTHS